MQELLVNRKGQHGVHFGYFRYIILSFVLVYAVGIIFMSFYHTRKPWRGGVGADNPKHSSSDWLWRLGSSQFPHPGRKNASQCAARRENGKNSMEKIMVQVHVSEARDTGLLEAGMDEENSSDLHLLAVFQRRSHVLCEAQVAGSRILVWVK
jgi:hypothetical protein